MSDSFGHPRTALVLGGRSEIAHAILRALQNRGLERVVAGVRSPDRAEEWFEDHPLPGLDIQFQEWDVNDIGGNDKLLQRARDCFGDIDVVICAVGSLGHGAGLTAEPAAANALFLDNMAGPATALLAASQALTEQGHGALVVLSSVAGLRARRSNFLYGAAKAGLDTFAQGLSDALRETPVRVHLIRPGFVHSKMTADLPAAPFATRPEAVADAVVSALSGPSSVVHVPRILGPLFAGFRLAPRPIWRLIAGDR